MRPARAVAHRLRFPAAFDDLGESGPRSDCRGNAGEAGANRLRYGTTRASEKRNLSLQPGSNEWRSVLRERRAWCRYAAFYDTAARDAWVESASVVTADGLDVHVDAAMLRGIAGWPVHSGRVTVSGLEDTIDSFRICFERGEVRFSIFRDDLGVSVHASRTRYSIASEEFGHIGSAYQCAYAYWTAFLDGLQKGEANWTSAHDALLTTKIVEEVYAQPQVAL